MVAAEGRCGAGLVELQSLTTAEVRADEGKATDYSAPAHSTGWFDRLLRTRRAFTARLLLPKTPEGAILASQRPGIRGMSVQYDYPSQHRLVAVVAALDAELPARSSKDRDHPTREERNARNPRYAELYPA
jgi:hypothetical protein